MGMNYLPSKVIGATIEADRALGPHFRTYLTNFSLHFLS